MVPVCRRRLRRSRQNASNASLMLAYELNNDDISAHGAPLYKCSPRSIIKKSLRPLRLTSQCQKQAEMSLFYSSAIASAALTCDAVALVASMPRESSSVKST